MTAAAAAAVANKCGYQRYQRRLSNLVDFGSTPRGSSLYAAGTSKSHILLLVSFTFATSTFSSAAAAAAAAVVAAAASAADAA